MKIAIVHDWLTGIRGGELVLDAIVEMFPQARLYTLLAVDGHICATTADLARTTSWLQNIPSAHKIYRHFLPLMPKIIESFDFTGYDLILSSSHCVAKGIRKPKDSIHVSYVHAPMRYMWDRFDDYFSPEKTGIVTRIAAHSVKRYLQNWDRKTAQQLDGIMANSHFIAEQIRSFWQREAQVVHPFVNLQRFRADRRQAGEKYLKKYLMIGALVPYKRVDLAIEAFNELGLPLQIVGSGPEEKRLKSMARANIEFLGARENDEIAELYQNCKAFIFPGKEDFGITPLEAMASGTPVIAYAGGGAKETVTDETGLFFYQQSVPALIEALKIFESSERNFDPATSRKQAEIFSKQRFQREYWEIVSAIWNLKKNQALPLERPKFLDEQV